MRTRRFAALIVGLALTAAACDCGHLGIDHRIAAGRRADASPLPPTDQACVTLAAAQRRRRSSSRSSATAAAARSSSTKSRRRWSRYRQRSSTFVLMAGDNIYEGPATPEDYRLKFEEPYKPLLDAGVKFYAALGNHDDPNQIYYKPFNMDGHRYYTFVPPVDPITRWDTRVGSSRSTAPTSIRRSCGGSRSELAKSRAEWKIAFLHHPLYTSGRYTLRGARHRFALESILRQRRRRRRVLRARAHLPARRAAERHPVFHHRRRRLAARRRRRARRRRSRAATTRTITSCWPRSPTTALLPGDLAARHDGRRRRAVVRTTSAKAIAATADTAARR